MKIGIIGVGGVGGYFGGKLAKYANEQLKTNQADDKVEIYFVARNRHLEVIKEKGLELETVEGSYIVYPTLATDDISELPKLDVCLVCVKSYDLQDVMEKIDKVIDDKTIILPLLNGVDVVERIREVTKKGIICPACVYVGTHIEEPGKVTQKGGACTIHFGMSRNVEGSVDIKALLDASNIKNIMYDDPYTAIWEKFIFIASYGIVTAVSHKVLGAVMEEEVLADDVKTIMTEIATIAKRAGVVLKDTIVMDSFEKGSKFPYDAKTSFQRDYENPDKRDERDLFGNAIVRLGEKYNVSTPKTKAYVNALQN